MNARTRKLAVQSLSELGDFLFLSSVTIFLLKQGYSAVAAVGAMAAMALPNTLLGPWLGRFVDRTDRARLYLTLNLALAACEVFLLCAAGWLVPGLKLPSETLPPILVAMALVYSPLQTIVQHYLVPSLVEEGEGENSIYAKWSIFQKTASLIGAGLSAVSLFFVHPGWLILADACTFVLAGLVLTIEPAAGEGDAGEARARAGFAAVLGNHELLAAAANMWIFALAIVPLADNLVSVGARTFALDTSRLGLVTWFVTSCEWLGSWTYRRYGRNLVPSRSSANAVLAAHALPLAAAGLSIWLYSFPGMLLAVMLLALLKSPWSTQNTVLFRRATPAGRYGEYIGYVRVPRAGLTFAGSTGFAFAVDRGFPGATCLALAFGLALAVGAVSVLGRWAEVEAEPA